MCVLVILHGLWHRQYSIMLKHHSFSVDRFMRHRSASLAKSRPKLQLGGAKPERFFQEKLPQGIFAGKPEGLNVRISVSELP